MFRAKDPALKPVVGLEIRDKEIVVTLIRQKAHEYRPVRVIHIPVPSDAIQNGIIQKPKVLSYLLRNIWKKYKLKYKEVNMIIQGEDTLLRQLVVPIVKKSKQFQSIHKQVSQYAAFAGKPIYIDYIVLGNVHELGERKQRILLGVATQKLMDPYISVLENARLHLAGITFSTIAHIQALGSQQLRCLPDQCMMLIDIYENQTYFLIYREQVIIFTHCIRYGSAHYMTEADATVNFFLDFKKIIFGKNDAGPITAVFLQYFDSKIQLVEKKLKQYFPALNITRGFGTLDFQSFEPKRHQLWLKEMVGIGLSKPDPLPLNLIPEHVQLLRKLRAKLKLFFKLIILLSIVSLIIFFVVYNLGDQLRKGIHVLSNKSNTYTLEVEKVYKLEDANNLIHFFIQGRRQSLEKEAQRNWRNLLIMFAKVTPDTIRILNFSLNGSLLEVSGEARQDEDVFVFSQQLREYPSIVQNIQIKEIASTMEKSKEFRFAMIITIREGGSF